MKPFNIGAVTDRGRTRETNQDAYRVFIGYGEDYNDSPDFGCFIVADGMGGQQAASIVVRTFMDEVIRSLYLPLLTAMPDEPSPDVTDIMVSAVQKANWKILDTYSKGATTVTGTVIVGDLIHLVHVGNTRCYLITKDVIEQLTIDHTLQTRLIDLGPMLPPGIEEEPATVLYRAVGQAEELEVDTLTRQIKPGDFLVLCSDGIFNNCSDQTIKEIVMNFPPQAACEKLAAISNGSLGNDDVTIIVVGYRID
jgi:PPM family protein phosphatase